MKAYSAVHAVIVLVVGLAATEPGYSQENAPKIVQRGFVGDAFFVGFLPNTSGWVSVDASSDLLEWRTVASVATTNGVTEFVDGDGALAERQFYRLRQPGASVDEAEAGWLQHTSGNYRFHLQHVRSYPSALVLDADVTVRAGQKEVTNAQAEGEQPVQQPEASDFPTVPELFGLLRGAQQAGCWRVAVIYDQAQRFPLWCVIERVAGGFKHIESYRITRFTPDE